MELWQLFWQPLSADAQPIWEYIYFSPLLTSGCQIVANRSLGLHGWGLMSLIRLQYTASKLTYCTHTNNVHCYRKMTTLYFLLFSALQTSLSHIYLIFIFFHIEAISLKNFVRLKEYDRRINQNCIQRTFRKLLLEPNNRTGDWGLPPPPSNLPQYIVVRKSKMPS